MATPSYNLNTNRVSNPNVKEVLRQSLYDFQIYPTAGVTALNFFTLPKGQGQTSQPGGVAGQTKAIGDTNMDQGSQLPAGKQFRIESIEVPFFPGSISTANLWLPALNHVFAAAAATAAFKALDDVTAFYTSGELQLFILSKSYLDEAPLCRFPPKTGVDYRVALASNSATVGEVAAGAAFATGRPYQLKPEITITSVQNFSVNLNWLAAVATPSGFNARVGVILDGVLERSSQ